VTDSSKIEAAAKAAFPELWPTTEEELSLPQRAARTFNRQYAIERITKAIEAYNEAPGEMGDADPVELANFGIELPSDAAIVQQVLTAITYVDNDGKMAYTVNTQGEGLLTTWLGMVVLTQNYLLAHYGFGGND
jgi:hypothetical protein